MVSFMFSMVILPIVPRLIPAGSFGTDPSLSLRDTMVAVGVFGGGTGRISFHGLPTAFGRSCRRPTNLRIENLVFDSLLGSETFNGEFFGCFFFDGWQMFLGKVTAAIRFFL